MNLVGTAGGRASVLAATSAMLMVGAAALAARPRFQEWDGATSRPRAASWWNGTAERPLVTSWWDGTTERAGAPTQQHH